MRVREQHISKILCLSILVLLFWTLVIFPRYLPHPAPRPAHKVDSLMNSSCQEIMADISESDRKIIEQIRQDSKHFLATSTYDTDYNILRFLQGWKYDVNNARFFFQRHLKVRRIFQLDDIEKLEDDEIVKSHFPSGFLGTTGRDNKIVMIEAVGRTDIDGILRSIQATEFIRYRMKFFERLFKAINEQEALTGRQSGAVYIFDLDGLSFDPFLLPTLNGAYKILWSVIMINYCEWVDVILIVNVPTFFNVLWKAFSPFLPENTREKIKVLGNDWKAEILENYIEPANLPVHWGGKMVDENGDPMCRTRIVVPQGKIPQSLYWRNSGRYKELPDDQVSTKTVGAGSITVFSYFIPEPGTKLNYYIQSADDYTFAIFYSDDPKDTDVGKMEEAFPPIEVPGNLAPDSYFFIFDKAGAYHIKFGNEKAWFLSISFKYRWEFVNADGTSATVVPLNDNARE